MNLNILLPFRVFAQKTDVLRIVAETPVGSYGFLPNRLDCVATLTPGILMYESESDGEVYVAVDEGVLIKTGTNVFVSVRRALGGTDLDQLHATVEKEFRAQDEEEQDMRTVMTKLETGFLRRLANLHND